MCVEHHLHAQTPPKYTYKAIYHVYSVNNYFGCIDRLISVSAMVGTVMVLITHN